MGTLFQGNSRLRWLVAGLFSGAPSGRRVRVSGERFPDVMKTLGPAATITLPDALGNSDQLSTTLSFSRPRDFRLSDVTAGVEGLRTLAAVAESLDRNKDPITVTAAVAKVKAAVGDGPLAKALAEVEGDESVAAPQPSSTAPATSPPSTSSSGDAVDAIFAKAGAPTDSPVQTAKSGLDAFVGAMRGGKRTAKATAEGPRREAAKLLRAAVDQTAGALLGHPVINALETAWRGLRMVVAAAPGDDDLRIDLTDVGPDALTSVLERVEADPVLDRPDAVFITYEIDDVGTLRALAESAERARVPVVVAVNPALFGGSAAAPGTATGTDAWEQFRREPASRWLSVTANPVVLANDPGTGSQRLVIGSPALAVAAILSASISSSGALAATVGRTGAFTAPAAWDVDDGHGESFTIPTAVFVDTRAQRTLADLGVIGLGSPKGSDQVILAAAPTVGASGRSLPAQILLGRGERLASFVRSHLAPNATPAEIHDAFDQASGAFLPRGPSGAATFQATQSAGTLSVRVNVAAAAAGANAEDNFDL